MNKYLKIFKILKPAEVKVLTYLSFIMNRDTDETPVFTISSLARDTNLSRDTVRPALKGLESLKIIAIFKTEQGQKTAQVLMHMIGFR